jgi:CelD/BcsL family acetyltransferase involved in cellulose biosynthesis
MFKNGPSGGVTELSMNAAIKLREKSVDTSRGVKPMVAANLLQQRVTLISNITDLREIEESWRKLEQDNKGRTTVFQSFDWVIAWCEAYLSSSDAPEILVVTGYQSHELVFVLPLCKTSKHGLKILDWLTDPMGQYGDILCAKNQNADIWLKAAFANLSTLRGIDLIRLRHVRDNSNVAAFAKQNLHDAKYYERAPYLDLTAFKSEADYDARYTSTQRKRRKKIRKSLEDLGPVNFATVPVGPQADAAIDQSIIEKNAWLSDRGRHNRVMGCPNHVAFLKKLSRVTSGNFRMLTTALTSGGKPVSWEIGFRYHDTHFAYITSHVNALTDLSPGRLHMDLSQRVALADGQKVFDLMVPYDLHKESWSSGTIATNDYFKPVTLLGSLYGSVYLRTIRPVIRRIYYSLPPQVLRFLQTFTRH